MTGTSKDRSISFTASRPELPSASCISARIIPGRLALASATASACVRATPSTRWPRLSTNPFEIECDEGFVLYNQNVSGDLSCELAAGFLDKIAQRRSVDIQNLCGIIFRQAFESDQQEGLARFRRDLRKMALDRLARAARRMICR